jgi:membrane peptidoglycan carboxypeptidase
MELKEIQEEKSKKEKCVHIRISKEDKKFLEDRSINISRFFRKALEELKKQEGEL